MLLKEAGQAKPDWYLIARNGDLTARVTPGLRIGEGECGELQLNPKGMHALIEFTIDGQRHLQVSALPETLELALPDSTRARSVSIDAAKGANIHLPNNTLCMHTDFMAAGRHPEAMDLDLVQIPLVTVQALAAPEHPALPCDPQPVELQAQLPAAKFPVLDMPVESSDWVREILITELPYSDELAGSARITNEVENSASTQARAGRDTASILRTRNRQPRRPTGRLRMLMTTVVLGLLLLVSFPFAVKIQFGDVWSFLDTTDNIVPDRRLKANLPALGRVDFVPEPSLFLPGTNPLESITGLLAAEDLPDEATINFVLQFLKTRLRADGANDAARIALEDLTRRLADEARIVFDQGNVSLASRLVEQASDSGVLREYARLAANYVATPEPAATATVPSAEPMTVASQNATAQWSPSELQRHFEQALRLYEAGHINTPTRTNAVSILRRVLEHEQGNLTALNLLKQCADQLVADAREADRFGRAYEARNLIEEVLAFYPDHAEAKVLWKRWRI